MDYKIIKKEAFIVIGKIIKISTCDGEHHQSISEFWSECFADGTCERLYTLGNTQNMIGISLDFQEDMEQMSYMIAIEDVSNLEDTEFHTREIPAANWAIFASVGPLPFAIQGVLKKIFQEWFPATGYEHANAPVLEVYPSGDTSASDYKCEVWIPILRK